MQLHQRGVDLLVNVLDAADSVEQLSQDELRLLLKEIAEIMCQILERDAIIALSGRPASSHREAQFLGNKRNSKIRSFVRARERRVAFCDVRHGVEES